MKLSLFVSSLVLSLSASAFAANVPAMVSEKPDAKAKTYMVKGMHCAGCVDTVKSSICVEGKYAACSVVLLDEKEQLGQIRITPNPGQIVSKKEISKAVKDAGYKLTR